MEPVVPLQDEARASTGRVILPCASCGRAVSVYGRMRRVLCGCGETLMEIGREPEPA